MQRWLKGGFVPLKENTQSAGRFWLRFRMLSPSSVLVEMWGRQSKISGTTTGEITKVTIANIDALKIFFINNILKTSRFLFYWWAHKQSSTVILSHKLKQKVCVNYIHLGTWGQTLWRLTQWKDMKHHKALEGSSSQH